MESEWVDVPQFAGLQLRQHDDRPTWLFRFTDGRGPVRVGIQSDSIVYVEAQRDDRGTLEPWPISYLVGLVYPHLAEE